MNAEEIRRRGFEWPGSELVDAYVIESEGELDLAATLAGLRQALGVYQRELDGMHAFQQNHNAVWSDVTDRRGELAKQVEELRRGIRVMEAVIEKAN
jgi:hypothetical protein